jgi:hypothetical protein
MLYLECIDSEVLKQNQALCFFFVLGFRKEAAQVFSSAPIVKRYDYSTVLAADGIRVVIGGLFNKLRSQDNGFPSTVF